MGINENYHTLKGVDIAEEGGGVYAEYRKRLHEDPKKFIVGDFPLFLDIEATSACNLRCPFCVQTITKFKKGFMSMTLYMKLIDEAAANGCYGCKYHTIGRGEPLLHLNIIDMVKYAKDKGLIDVYLNTNATLLTEPMSYGLLDAGLDRISFSIEGSSEEEYEKNRVGAKFYRVVKSIFNFYEVREKHNYPTKIRIQSVNVRDYDLNTISDFWIRYADEVSYIDYKDMLTRKSFIASKWSCPQLWQRMSILWNGIMLPCNHDDRRFASLGLFDSRIGMSIEKAWKGDAFNFMRELHRTGNSHIIGACDGCTLRAVLAIK